MDNRVVSMYYREILITVLSITVVAMVATTRQLYLKWISTQEGQERVLEEYEELLEQRSVLLDEKADILERRQILQESIAQDLLYLDDLKKMCLVETAWIYYRETSNEKTLGQKQKEVSEETKPGKTAGQGHPGIGSKTKKKNYHFIR